MTVKELIWRLLDCNPSDLVMFDLENSLENDNSLTEKEFSVDEVLIGGGTLKGFVFLREELYEE